MALSVTATRCKRLAYRWTADVTTPHRAVHAAHALRAGTSRAHRRCHLDHRPHLLRRQPTALTVIGTEQISVASAAPRSVAAPRRCHLSSKRGDTLRLFQRFGEVRGKMLHYCGSTFWPEPCYGPTLQQGIALDLTAHDIDPSARACAARSFGAVGDGGLPAVRYPPRRPRSRPCEALRTIRGRSDVGFVRRVQARRLRGQSRPSLSWLFLGVGAVAAGGGSGCGHAA